MGNTGVAFRGSDPEVRKPTKVFTESQAKAAGSSAPKWPANKYLVRYFFEDHLYPTSKFTKLIIIYSPF